jgi:hypothetical protein
MSGYYDPIVAEVRRYRAELLEEYGGWEGYRKHQEEDRPRLEAAGWRFETPEEREVRIARHKRSEEAHRCSIFASV